MYAQSEDPAAAGSGAGPASGRGAALAAGGGLVAAIAASSCCIVPLVLFTAGIGGAWVGNLAALAPYQPVFLTLAIGFLAAGYHLGYRRAKAACRPGDACARPLPGRIVKGMLWAATLLVGAALAFPYVAPWLLGT